MEGRQYSKQFHRPTAFLFFEDAYKDRASPDEKLGESAIRESRGTKVEKGAFLGRISFVTCKKT